ncbi:MAG: nucleotidyltransferase domain-containing protein [Candidatus Bathyarchaeia archaeon]
MVIKISILESVLTYNDLKLQKVIFTKPTEKIKVAERVINGIREIVGSNLISIILFGSVATGTSKRKSDIDILAIIKENPEVEKVKLLTLDEKIKEDIVAICLIDLESLFSRLIKSDPFLLNILSNGKIIYDNLFIQHLQNLVKKGLFGPNKEMGEFLLEKAKEQLIFGQLILKDFLRFIYWAVCYASDAYLYIKEILAPLDINKRFMLFKKHVPGEIAQLFDEVLNEVRLLEEEESTDAGKLSKLHDKAEKFIHLIQILVRGKNCQNFGENTPKNASLLNFDQKIKNIKERMTSSGVVS